MSLSEQIQKDIVAAMKAKEEARLSVLRMIKAAVQLKEVEKMRKLDESESIQLLQTLVKQRKESIDQFSKGGRQDLVDKEQAEKVLFDTQEKWEQSGDVDGTVASVLSSAEMTKVRALVKSGTLDAAINKAIADTGATSLKQMGGVVKAAKQVLAGKTVDGKALSDRIRERLSKLG